jgi:hypothetical protein
MDLLDEQRIDRTALEIGRLTDRPNDRQDWLSKTPEKRFEALELLRQIAYGYDPATERPQRVLQVVKRERR